MVNNITKSLSVFFFLCLFPIISYSQFDLSISANHPPTPNAASLAKYGEIPITHFNGTANISIPLETIQDGNIRLPLALNYHSSGLKVDETASWVGLGWSLQSGGVISRTVRGLPDERASDNQVVGFLDGPIDLQNYDTYQNQPELVDSESDIYFFNLGGYSGSFTFYWDTNDELQVLLTDYSEVDIEPILTNTNYNKIIWKVTLPDGIRFYLGDTTDNGSHVDDAVSYSKYYTNGTGIGVDNPTIDSWFVVRIEDLLSGGYLDFNYEWEAYQFRTHGSSRYFIDSEGRNIFTNGNLKRYDQTSDHIVSMSLSPRLSSITCRQYSFEFIAGETRKDLDPTKANIIHPMYVTDIAAAVGTIGNPKVLDRIEKRKLDGTCLKQYSLTTDYFTSSTAGYRGNESNLYNVQYNNITYKPDRLRLRLTDVTEESCTNTDKKIHSIAYTSNRVVRRLSLSSDHWGYHNGKTNNLDPAPKLVIQNSVNNEPLIDLSHIDWLSDKSSVFSAMEDGMISKITYPTGGTTTFDFAANAHRTSSFQQVTTFPATDNTCSGPTANPCNDTTAETNGVNISNSGNVSYEIVVDGRRSGHETASTPYVLKFEYKIGSGGWIFYDELMLNNGNNFTINHCYRGSNFIGNNVKFRVTNTSSPNINTFISLQVQRMEWTNVTRNETVGGLRLKRLTHNPKIGPQIVENLKYTTQINGSISSGKLYGLPNYILDMNKYPGASIVFGSGNCEDTPYQLFSGSQVAPASTQGSHIGYKRVFHELGDGSEGYTEYSYEEDADFEPSLIVDFPPPPEQYFDRLAGKPEFVHQYKKNGTNNYTVVSEQFFDYEKLEIAEGLGHRFYDFLECDIQGDTDLQYTSQDFFVYNTKSWAYQNKTSTSILDGVSNTIDYTYNTRYPTLIDSEIQTNSDDKIYETKYFYPDSYPDSPPNIESFLDEKKQLSPWKIEKFYTDPLDLNKSGLVGGESTRWGYYDSNGVSTYSETDNCFPNAVFSIENTWDDPSLANNEILGDLENAAGDKQLTFLEYDLNAGKPTKIQRLHWASTDDYTYDAQGKQLTWTYDEYSKSWQWHPGTDLMKKAINIDGTSKSFTWDSLLRLKTLQDDQRGTKTTYTYSYDQTNQSKNFHKESHFFPKLGDVSRTLNDIHFMDGLSRKYQTKKIAQGPTIGESVILSTEYDAYKRVIKEYEPRSVSNVSDITSTISGDATVFEFETSPLNRITKTTSPETWMFSIVSYGSNTSSEGSGFLSNRLNKQTVTDANGNKVETFTDIRGREVLNRAFDGSLKHDTRTYYDGLDRKVLIVPPGATTSSQDLVHRWTYHPTGNIASEIIPGKGLMEYRYNKRELLAYSRDPLQAQTRWRAITYDDYGNLDKQGWRNTISNLVDDEVGNAIIDVEKINYDFGTTGSKTGKLSKSQIQEINSMRMFTYNYTYDNSGRISTVRFNHPISVASNSLIHEFTYDSADNNIQQFNDYTSISDHPLEYSIFKMIDHAGRLKEEWYGQGINRQNRLSSYVYTEKNQIDQLIIGKDLQTVDYEYLNNQLLSNINGSALTVGDLYQQELFYNNPKTAETGEGRKNGDISSWEWRISGEPSFYYNYKYDGLDRLKRALGNGSATGKYSTAYTYDKRGNTTYLERRNADAQTIDVLVYTYGDGNQIERILDLASLRAEGYNGTSTRYYKYDSNGNVNDDESRDITSIYNHLNLPDEYRKDSGNYIEYLYDEEGNLLQKAERENYGAIVYTNYLGSIEYESVGNGNAQIKQIKHSNGFFGLGPDPDSFAYLQGTQSSDIDECHIRIDSDENIINNAEVNYFGNWWIELNPGFSVSQGSSFLADFKPYGKEEWNWIIKDHLGNTRVIFDNDGNVSQRNSFYPFNLRHDFNSVPSYEWNIAGGEEQKGVAKHMDVMPFRVCDRTIGRFTGVDPLADQFPGWSPYHYTYNNPIRFIDPTGMAPEEPPGEVTWSKQYNHGTMYQYDDGNYYWAAGNEAGGVDWSQYSGDSGWTHHSTDDLHDSSGGLGEFAGDVRDIAVESIGLALSVVGGGGSGATRMARAAGAVDDVVKVGSKLKGAANPKVARAIKEGKAAHKAFANKVKAKPGWTSEPQNLIDPKTGKQVIPDALTPSGAPVELKPFTPSGIKQGARQLPKYERATGQKGRVIYYKKK